MLIPPPFKTSYLDDFARRTGTNGKSRANILQRYIYGLSHTLSNSFGASR